MLRNYLKVAIRNLTRNLTFSIINIVGLSLGITISIFIMLWVTNELSFDRFHPNYNRITQARFFGDLGGDVRCWRELSFLAFQDLKYNHSGIKTVAISDLGSDHLLTSETQQIYKKGRFASPEFLDIFHFEMIRGTRPSSTDKIPSIILTSATAKALFGKEDPLNRMIRLDNTIDVVVKGIIQDVPPNSTLQFDYLVSFQEFQHLYSWVNKQECFDDWMCDAFLIYAELETGVMLEDVNRELKLVLANTDERFQSKELFLYPMERWNLHSEFEGGKEASVDWSDYVTGFSLLAIGILLVACINFMNLSTARSQRRAREVGIRKVSGSRRKDLIVQFLSESMLMCAMSFLLAILMAQLLLPIYNSLIDKQLFIPFDSPLFWLLSLMILSVTGLVAGAYPAFHLSSFNPSKVLKGKLLSYRKSSVIPREVLVIFQFGFSMLLIIGTGLAYQQINYTMDRQLGFEKEGLLSIPNNPEMQKNYNGIKQSLLASGAVASVTKSNSPITEIFAVNFLDWQGNDGVPVPITNIYADHDYLQTMGIKLLVGRDFSQVNDSDTAAVLLSQAAIDIMGLKNPIGSTVTIAGNEVRIIGITENVVMQSPYEEAKPMYIILETDWQDQDRQFVSVKLQLLDDVRTHIKKVEDVFRKLNPSYPFQFSFVDMDYNKKFESIVLIRKLTNIFAALALLIAFLGLFGLAAFTAERRQREFGLRIILGAHRSHLIVLISRDFTRVIVISFLFTIPLAYWAVNEFLSHFEYRVTFNWWIVPITGMAVLLGTLAIVVSQTLQAASVNPTESLKCD